MNGLISKQFENPTNINGIENQIVISNELILFDLFYNSYF
jgi:hypothetical protein